MTIDTHTRANAPRRSRASRAVLRVAKSTAAFLTVGTYMLLGPPSCAVFTLTAFLVRRDPLRRTQTLQGMIAWAYRTLHDWMRVVRVVDFDPRKCPEGIPDGPCMVVANHPTLMDVTAITAMLGGACTVVKREIYHRPILNRMLAASGHVEGPSELLDQRHTERLIEKSVAWLDDGFRMVIFPEGTRSNGDTLGPFSRTVFEIACRAGVPVVALTVDSSPPYLEKGGSLYHPPIETSVLRIELLDVFETCPDTDSRELRDRVASRYQRWQSQSVSPGSRSPGERSAG